MRKTTEQKHRAYLAAAVSFLFNHFWLAPDRAGTALAETAREASEEIFPDEKHRAIRIDWLREFFTSFCERMKKIIGE